MDKPGGGSWHRFRVEKPQPASFSRRSPSASVPGEMEDSSSTHNDSGVSGSPTAPGTLAMYACIRCRNSKKKCDRIQPECAACKRLGARCFFPSPVASSASQAAALRARVAWLSSFVDTLLPAGSAPVSCYDTDFDLSTLPLTLPNSSSSPDTDADTTTTTTTNTNTNTDLKSSDPIGGPTPPTAKTSVSPEDFDMDGAAAGPASAGSIHQQHTPSSIDIPEPAAAQAPQQQHHHQQYQHPLPPPPSLQQLPLSLPPVSASTPTAYTLPSPSNSRDAARYMMGEALSAKPRFAPIRLLTGRFDRMHLVRAYFRHMHRSYPFLYEEAILSAAESHIGRALFEDGCEIDLASAKLYLVMMLGLEAISRFGSRSSRGKGGAAPTGLASGGREGMGSDSDEEDRDIAAAALSSVRMPYQDIVLACLRNRCIPAVEALLLLALFALFDPDGWSAWVIVGMLGREAVLLGLNRRWPSDPAEPDLLQREFRHRLFWSIFSLDRLVASVYGLSLAIQDFDSNLALPGVTTEEFAASSQAEHIATLQIARQATALRVIEGRCLSLVHMGHDVGSGVAAAAIGQGLSLGHSAAPFQQQPQQQRMLLPSLRERRAMIEELRGAADNWYTQGTLLARREAHAVHFHNTITWLNTNYHGMLMLLYCPSLFNSGPATSEDLLDLHRTIGKYVQSVHAQFLDRQLALNWTTMSRMLLVCRILLHAYLNLCTDTDAVGASSGNRNNYSHGHGHSHGYSYSCQAPPEHLPDLLAEQLDMVIQCENILHAFQPSWVFARKGAVLYRRLEAALRYRLQHAHVQSAGSGIDVANDIHDICDDAEQLVQQALGVASTYNYLAGEPRMRPRKAYA
ncbi:multidrug-resistance protein transcriptional activator [Ophiostoma piceae UAMH 11346]|uniref:Multidrug-resistance protein transcriptional activator n=1 Tax=Ophiostoma piceae (strain UAMH 11346) TaxID=1262450 RepID=S3C501_OPHP1|nr:multidrug-resistance protein transcriptional activator [Ophiostoma piceae UAMH 11346]